LNFFVYSQDFVGTVQKQIWQILVNYLLGFV